MVDNVTAYHLDDYGYKARHKDRSFVPIRNALISAHKEQLRVDRFA